METTTSQPRLATMNELIKTAWEIFKKKPLLTYAVVIIPAIASIVFQMLLFRASELGNESMILYLIYWIVITTITIGTVTIGLKIVRGETTSLNDWGSNAHRILYYIGGYILTNLIIFVGVLLFIVPGVYYALRFVFVPTLLVDTELGIMEAMRVSTQMTNGLKWQLFWYYIGFCVMAVFGTLFTLGLGLLIITPLATLIPLVLYVQLKPTTLTATAAAVQ